MHLCPSNIGVVIPQQNTQNNKTKVKPILKIIFNNNTQPDPFLTYSIVSPPNFLLDLYCPVELYTIPGAITPSIDIWSFGIISYYFITHKMPFKSKEEIYNSLNNPPSTYFSSISCYRYDINYILKECLSPNPSLRPTSQKLYDSLTNIEIAIQKQCIIIIIYM